MKKKYCISAIFTAAVIMLCGCSDSTYNHPMLKKAVQSKRMGEYRNAELCYKKYLAKNPNAEKIHLELAELYDEHLEDYLLAIYHYKEYLRLLDNPDSNDAKNVNGFISRCEQRYLAKGKSVKKVLMTDEEELERMADAYRKKLVNEEKAMALELERLKKEAAGSEKVEENTEKKESEKENAVEKTAESVNVIANDNSSANAAEENTVAQNLAENGKNDSAVDSVEKKPVEDMKKTAETSEKVQEQAKEEKVVAADEKKNEKTSVKQTASIKESAALPDTVVQKEKKSVEQTEKTVDREYTVQKGDTFTHLSRKFYGTVRYHKQLMEYNKITKPSALRAGKVIKIPSVKNLKGIKNAQ